MQYIIFGAGDDGRTAMNMLGERRCAYFYDMHKSGEIILGRRVLNYEQLQEKYATGHYIIVVASSRYQTEIELFLKLRKMNRYFIFSVSEFSNINRYRPDYLLYGEWGKFPFSLVLMYYCIQKYSHIAISSINSALPYLISEIAFQCQDWRVDYIIDESIEPGADVSYMGIPCRTLSEVEDKIDCLILNASYYDPNIRDLIPEIPSYSVVDCFNVMKFVPAYHHPELKRYYNIHSGKRCFIIGNGPSLRMSDLDILQEHGEISFGVNAIFKAFKRTRWRPTYYFAPDVDGRYFPEYDIYHYVSRDECVAFYSDPIHWSRLTRGILNDRECIHTEQCNGSPIHMPPFSSDICEGVWGGNTSLYCCIQIAAYMGFKQIYIMGADANFDDANAEEYEKNHFTKKYCEDAMKKDYEFDVIGSDYNPITFQRSVMQAFRKAERYSRAHGFRIYNATRGGKLEEFQRVNFDSLFSQGGDLSD